MRLCRFILTPISPWASRLRSDTLNGLVLWHLAQREGDAACEAMIEAFEAGEPPFALSSPMRLDHLPMPALPPVPREKFISLASGLFPGEEDQELALFKALRKFKSFRKKPWLPLEDWKKHRLALSAEALFKDECEKQDEKEKGEEDKFSKTAYIPHVSIDRQSGAARDGQLFFNRANFHGTESRYHLYARAKDPDWLLELLAAIGAQGFGKDTSLGMGQFEVKLDEAFNPAELEDEDGKEHFLLLSLCASPHMEPLAGHYKLEEKRGKVGPGTSNPFKRPFLAVSEGALLREPPAPPYVLRDLNANKKIVQILEPMLLPCRLAASEA